jgi:hypothetical protein
MPHSTAMTINANIQKMPIDSTMLPHRETNFFESY